MRAAGTIRAASTNRLAFTVPSTGCKLQSCQPFSSILLFDPRAVAVVDGPGDGQATASGKSVSPVWEWKTWTRAIAQ